MVRLSYPILLVLDFGSSNPEGFFFSFSKFLSLVSFFRVRPSVRVRFRVSIALGLVLGFEPSSPIVRELVLSLTRLSFLLVRFRHNLGLGWVV